MYCPDTQEAFEGGGMCTVDKNAYLYVKKDPDP